MVRTSPVPAKENEVPHVPSPIKKKSRASLLKRVSFGHVELHTFLKDGDRTPSPMMPPPGTQLMGQAAEWQANPHAVAALRAQTAPAIPPPPASRNAGPALADKAPSLSDLLRDDDDARAEPADSIEDDEDAVVFQPRNAVDGVTMDFTQAYGRGIREVRADLQSSPAQEPAAAIPMDFTSSYGAGILSSGGSSGAEPMDEDEPAESFVQLAEKTANADARLVSPGAAAVQAEPLTYEGYLANHGIRFLDEMGAVQHKRPSLLGSSADGVGGMGGGDPQTDEIIAAACIRLQAESKQWGAEQLGASCAQLRAAISQTEQLVRMEAPTFFENLGSSAADLHALKALCRNGALAMWYEWRSKLEATNAQVLADSQSHLVSDISRLTPLLTALRDAHARAQADPRTADVGSRAAELERKATELGVEVARRESAVASATARVTAAREAAAALRAGLGLEANSDGTTASRAGRAVSLNALEEEEGALTAKLASLRASIDQLVAAAPTGADGEAGEAAASACARAQEQLLMTACLGWRAVALSSTLIELQFTAGVRLSAQLAPAADKASLRLRAPPTIKRYPSSSDASVGAEEAGGSDGLAAMLADMAICAVAREAASCVGLQGLPLLVHHLGTFCGRALELRKEVEALSAPYEILCTREPVIVGGRPGSAPVLTITFRNSEYRLRFKATLRIDALTMPPTVTYQRVDMDLCPAGLSHGTIANCVIGAMASTERVALLRLTAICAAVQEAANAECAKLVR